MDAAALMKAYEAGLGYKRGDALRPKPGSQAMTFDCVDDTVVVLSQDSLVPTEYNVIGEQKAYSRPSDQFIKFTIKGHDWERIP